MLKDNNLILSITFLLKIVLVNLITIKNIRNLNNYISEIHLIIKGSGNQEILNSVFYTVPSEVIVNGNSKGDTCKKSCDLDEDINNVVLKFENKIKSCNLMFNHLKNIIEIDLSYFDTSEVTDIQWMFCFCSNLEKINFGKINTSLVENMNLLFCGCSKLTTIDLSHFDTSKVIKMNSMFNSCTYKFKIFRFIKF